MSVTLSRATFNNVVQIIQPHVDTTDKQQSLVQVALADASNLRSQIQYGGGARVFASLLVRKCLDYGYLKGGEHALSAVLNEVYMLSGEGVQKQIDDLELDIQQRIPEPTPAKPPVEVVELPAADNKRERKHIFISYASDDRIAFVESYVRRLSKEGYTFWVDNLDTEFGGIAGGEKWQQSLANAINQASLVNLVITPDSVRSKWVHAEVRRAKALGIAILPIIARPIKTDADEAARRQLELSDLHYINFVKLGYENAIERVMNDLSRLPGLGDTS